ncbi:MAG: phosphatase PAP2 family protein [Acidobacteriota bacterium]
MPAPADAGAPADASIGGLFVELWHDLPRLASVSNLFILGGGGTVALAVEESDASILARVSNSEFGELFNHGSAPGDGWVQVGGALGTYVIGRVTGNATTLSVGTDLVQAQLLNAVLTTGVKYAAQRTRPDGGHHSFPSGHTSSSFAGAAVLSRHFGWRVSVPAYGVASWVAIARVEEHHHYVSDVVFGAALGVVSGRTVTVGKGSSQFRVSPALLPGGGGIYFTRK